MSPVPRACGILLGWRRRPAAKCRGGGYDGADGIFVTHVDEGRSTFSTLVMRPLLLAVQAPVLHSPPFLFYLISGTHPPYSTLAGQKGQRKHRSQAGG